MVGVAMVPNGDVSGARVLHTFQRRELATERWGWSSVPSIGT